MQNLSRYASHSCIIRHILRHNSVCSYCYIITNLYVTNNYSPSTNKTIISDYRGFSSAITTYCHKLMQRAVFFRFWRYSEQLSVNNVVVPTPVL